MMLKEDIPDRQNSLEMVAEGLSLTPLEDYCPPYLDTVEMILPLQR